MGVSEGTYELIEWYFLDGGITTETGEHISNIDNLVNYIIDTQKEKAEF